METAGLGGTGGHGRYCRSSVESRAFPIKETIINMNTSIFGLLAGGSLHLIPLVCRNGRVFAAVQAD